MIKVTDLIDIEEEVDVKFKLNFVDKASRLPSVDTNTINPNWFITRKLH